MNIISKRVLTLGILVIIIITTILITVQYKKSNSITVAIKNAENNYEVYLNNDGFSPKEISIPKNSLVIFINKTNKPFWPASDLHPTHVIYQNFDPKTPIPPEQSWSFKFEKLGKWRYHDHLFPYFTGIINIEDATEQIENIDCNNSSNQCWNENLFKALDSGGVIAAMKEIKRLYETDQKFTKNGCHRWAHIVGDMAFDKYGYRGANVDKWDLPIETTYCGYGFFHGIFEHFFRENPDIILARKICDRLEETLSSKMLLIRQTCFHGVGHGFMPEPPPQKTWGDPKMMMVKSLKACETTSLTNNPDEKMECMEGSFNVMADWMQQNKYGLKVNTKDPLKFCEEQSNHDRILACFYEYSMRLSGLAKDDMVKTARDYIKSTYDKELAEIIIDSATAGLVEKYLSETNFDFLIKQCYQISQDLKESCMSGLNGGLLVHGTPGKEYVKAIALCDSKELSENEKDACFKNLMNKITRRYQKEKIAKDICPVVPKRFQNYCKLNSG